MRRSTTWLPEQHGLPPGATRLARSLAAQASFAIGRREAVARHLLALAACRAGWLAPVARVPLFYTPGLLLADPRRETFYWSLDPGLPPAFEDAALADLTPLLARPA
jgi:hypothetical protein